MRNIFLTSEQQAILNQWDGKIILKGILDSEDALMAVKLGYDGIVVSNHGGRQLDGAPSSISILSSSSFYTHKNHINIKHNSLGQCNLFI